MGPQEDSKCSNDLRRQRGPLSCRAYATARSIAATRRPGQRPTTAVTYESHDQDETETREALRSGMETGMERDVRDDRRRAGGNSYRAYSVSVWAAPPGPSNLSSAV
jgi:hypothetical protein